MTEFRRIGIIGKRSDPRTGPTVNALCEHLLARDCTVDVDEALDAGPCPERAQRVPRSLLNQCDLVVVVGGDGTLLDAGRQLAPANVALLGVNQGRLGFMADVRPEEMLELLDQILDGRYVREQRLLLCAAVEGRNDDAPMLAVNDIVIRNLTAVRMLEFETWLGEEFISLHRADGFIVATPTGSTAYALSGGGPVVHPGLAAFSLVPICPHTLSDRPLVVGADRPVRVVLRGTGKVRATCTADGQINHSIAPGDALRVWAAPAQLQLIHPENYSYFNILRNKLHWGRERF